MKQLLFKVISFVFVLTVVMLVSAKALPDKHYPNVCVEDMDIKEAVVMDTDQDGHYETMKTIWCDWQNGIEVDLLSPIIYPPEASKGTTINELSHDPYPWRIRKRKPNTRKKNLLLEFLSEDDTTTVIYDYQKYDDDPNVYYTQYVPYTDVEEPMDENGIKILPNPASNDVTLTMDVPSTGNLTIKVYNQNGQEVATINNSSVGAGNREFNFNVSGLASGVYFVQTTIGTETFVNSLFVVK